MLFRSGRVRGEDFVYSETEYRFPVSMKTNVLGGVVFMNFSSASDKENNITLMKYVFPSYGTGLRIMVDKQSRTRLDFDVAKGSDAKPAFYIGLRDTF